MPSSAVTVLNAVYEEVLAYASEGLCVIPVSREDKKPLVKWAQFQVARPTEAQLKLWFDVPDPPNVGIVCGAVSGNLVVLDFDEVKLYDQMGKSMEETTTVVKTANRGFHVWLRTDATFAKCTPIPHLDVQAEGAYVLAPPSVINGKAYDFVSDEQPEIASIPRLFSVIYDMLQKNGYEPGASSPKQSIAEIRKGGLAEGDGRNNAGFKYALYLRRDVQLARSAVWAELLRWNELHTEPLPESELAALFESSLRYSEEKLEVKVDTEAEKYDVIAQRLFKRTDLVRCIKAALDEDIKGEERNKVYVFVLALSGVLKDNKKKQLIVLKGEPGGGKTHLANTVTTCFKTHKVGRMTEHALEYSRENETADLLYIQELLGLENDEKMGTSSIRFLSADDDGFKVEYTVKDKETGSFKTEEKTIPPITIVATTTKLSLEGQFERRTQTVNVDDTTTATEQVLKFKAGLIRDKFARVTGRLPETIGHKTLAALARNLMTRPVFFTTPTTLTTVFDATSLRVRGDYDKIQAATELIAILHARQRPRVVIDGVEWVFTLPQDAYYALQLGKGPILTMSLGMDERARDYLSLLIGMRTKTVTLVDEIAPDTFTLAMFREAITKSKKARQIGKVTARRILDDYQMRGLVDSNMKGGRELYKVIATDELISRLSQAVDTSDNRVPQIAALEQEAKEYFESIGLNVPDAALRVREDWTDASDKPMSEVLKEKDPADLAKLFEKPLANMNKVLSARRLRW